MTQLGAYHPCKVGVEGSNPSGSTNRFIIGIRLLLMLVGYAIQGYANQPIIEDV